MRAEADFDTLLCEGHAIIEDERRYLLSGALGEIGDLAERKGAFARRLEGFLASVPVPWGDGAPRRALERLVIEAQRNERIIEGAREGLRAAERRLRALRAARAGDVAYWWDGSRICSREDRHGRSVRA